MKSEIINCYCPLSEKIYGETMLTIYPGTKVDCSVSEKEHCTIAFRVFLLKNDIVDDIRLQRNARIYCLDGKVTGWVEQEMNAYRTLIENDSGYVVEIRGVVSQKCIESSSVVEVQLAKLFANGQKRPDKQQCQPHLDQFGYVPYPSNGKFTAYLIKEAVTVNEISQPRVIFIFEEEKLVALFLSRKVRIEHYESMVQAPAYELYHFVSGDESFKKRLQKFLDEIQQAH